MGEIVRFAVNGGTGSGYLAVPGGGGGPGVLVIQEWWGLVDHIKDVCDRFAAQGFVALAPDLYHGVVTKSPDEAGKMFMALNIAKAGVELRAAADALLARPEVTAPQVGAVGFCMGGQLALFAGVEYPDRIGAVVDFYGIHPHVRIDPARVRVPVLAHFGKRDASVKEADAKALVKKIQTAGGSIEAHYYDADHAFFNDTRPTVYDRGCATSAWTRTLVFLGNQLR
ncbi:MAG TPA: dienelactone hydrolase family protein [Gemmatimonadales bacterium]|nr:dienelactone hydrolase family protein [Gemmatimonadales bacterium]